MQIEREFIERRTAERRAAIRAGLAELNDRRGAMQRTDNSRITNWLERFDRARARANS